MADHAHEGPEFPSPGKLQAMGELLFLTMRSGDYARLPIARFHDVLEPAIDHKLLQLFRFDGVPRGALLWAKLSQQAEEKYLSGQWISKSDWVSGDRTWIVSFLAPYPRVTAHMIRWIEKGQNLPARDFRYLRLAGGWPNIRTTVRVNLDAPKGQRIRATPGKDLTLRD